MTLALIISPYNAPTAAERAANVRLGIALARWAAAQGYTPIGWWCDVDPDAPPADDPKTRAAALARSAERARMVGAAGGVAVAPGWMTPTAGMDADMRAWNEAAFYSDAKTDIEAFAVSLDDIEPYLLPEPVPMVPRAQVQAAVDAVRRSFEPCGCGHGECLTCYWRVDHGEAIDDVINNVLGRIKHHTGVTPTEVP
jgi:hypothetical protein